MKDITTAEALVHTLRSPNVSDSNGEVANVVDVINHLANATWRVAATIKDPQASPNNDETGGYVNSLIEAVMGMTTGLCKIASSINYLADAVRERDSDRTDTSDIG